MRPSLWRLAQHHCRTVVNPDKYKLLHSLKSLPFKPKSLLYAATDSQVHTSKFQIVELTDKYPDLQVVTVALDMKYNDAVSEIWFDEPIGINSYRALTRGKFEDEFSIVAHNKKIKLYLKNTIYGEDLMFLNFKNPFGKWSAPLSHLEISLPFDKEKTKYSSNSQMIPVTDKRVILNAVTENGRIHIKDINGENAFQLFEDIKAAFEYEDRSYFYLIETMSKNRPRNRFKFFPYPPGVPLILMLGDLDGSVHFERTVPDDKKSLITSEAALDLKETTYCKIYQVCIDDIKEPEIEDGLCIETYDRKYMERFQNDDTIIDGVATFSTIPGFSSNDRNYSAPGDYVKIESVESVES